MANETPVTDNKIIQPKTADAINDMFKELDNEEPKETRTRKEPDKTSKEEEEAPEEETKEAKEIEDIDPDDLELKESDDEPDKLSLEEDTKSEDIQAPPRKKEILKKYPNVFKDFPFLEKMMYRDREMNELFGSFDNAKEIAQRSQQWEGLENQLLSGNTVELLSEIKSSDENAFKMIVDDYLTNLAKVDKDSYYHVVGNLNRKLIMEMVEEANNSNDDNLKEAALIVNKFLFGSSKFTAPSRLAEKRDEAEKNEAETERITFLRERFETASNDLQTAVDNTLQATISEYIDPKGLMTPYVKKNAVNDAMDMIRRAITRNDEVKKNLERLWRESTEEKFSKDSLGKIKSYYLHRAKSVLKDAILKARSEALKESPTKRENEDEEKEETPTRETRRTPTGPPSQRRTGKNEMRKGESVTDFFMRD